MFSIKAYESKILEAYNNYNCDGLFLKYYDDISYSTYTTCKESATSFFVEQNGKIFVCLPQKQNNASLLKSLANHFIDLKITLVHTFTSKPVEVYLVEFPFSKFHFRYVGDLICFRLKNLFGIYRHKDYREYEYIGRYDKDPRVCRIYRHLLENFPLHYRRGYVHENILNQEFEKYGFGSGLFTFINGIIKDNPEQFKPILNLTFRKYVLPISKKQIETNVQQVIQGVAKIRKDLLSSAVYTTQDPMFEWALNGKIKIFDTIRDASRYSFKEYNQINYFEYGYPIQVEDFEEN